MFLKICEWLMGVTEQREKDLTTLHTIAFKTRQTVMQTAQAELLLAKLKREDKNANE